MHSPFLTGVWGHGASEQPRSDPAAQQAKSAAENLELRLDRALLTMEALWTLLRDKTGATEDELVNRIVEIDMTDGVLDGKVRRTALECPACNRRIPRRFPRCMYCGTEIVHDPFA